MSIEKQWGLRMHNGKVSHKAAVIYQFINSKQTVRYTEHIKLIQRKRNCHTNQSNILC